jgi:hypothetical protein
VNAHSYEPNDTGLCVQAVFRPYFTPHTSLILIISTKMNTPPPLDFHHEKGFEIPTKHKEAIRQLHWFTKILISWIETRYELGNSSVRRILSYDYPERVRPRRTGPEFKLSNQRVDEIIEYCSESWEHRIIKYNVLCEELELKCTPRTLERRLKQQGYFRCTACQKPFLTAA